MSLLADITRCWDAGCPERTACRRWLERDSGTVHAQSLFPYDEDIGNGCSLRIPPITEPSSLKKQAIAVLDDCSDRIDAAHENTIRRALEQLDD